MLDKTYEHLLRDYTELNNTHLRYLKRMVIALNILMCIQKHYSYILEECSTKEQMKELCLLEENNGI